MQVLNMTDYYKVGHYRMYPKGTTKIYSNCTPRKSRFKDIQGVVVFGLQYFIMEYLIRQWNSNFFNANLRAAWKITSKKLTKENADRLLEKARGESVTRYKRMMDWTLGKDSVSTDHIQKLWDLGYLPLCIKALPEGSVCPIGVPCWTITNTVDHAYWLVNYLETIMSAITWQPMTSATIAHEYRKLLDKYAMETVGNTDFVQWQGHDFSFRGMSSFESACTSGAGHLLSFTGTDTIPAIEFLERFYDGNVEKEIIGGSVPATEHSVMCMGTKDDEIGTFERLIELYPSGVLSVVSDTWDLWKVLTEYMPRLKNKILARNGKIVIRPDSGDPVDIICGNNFNTNGEECTWIEATTPAELGVVELLWNVFGGITNEQGYKVLDSHVGAIYGDSITLERAGEICKRLKAKGFASTNIVFGIGSFTYQHNTRDTFGFAIKATYGEVENVGREIFKDPITDDGTKRSAKGLLMVEEIMSADSLGHLHHHTYRLRDQQNKDQEQAGALETVFLDGKLTKFQTLSEIRERLSKSRKYEELQLQA